jgi:hypothetical protein
MTERVRVTRTAASPLVAVREMAEHTAVGDAYLRSLVSQQLRAGLRTTGFLAAFLICTPLVLTFVPSIRSWKLFGVNAAWLLLGVVVYPFLILLAHRFIRRVEINEAEFEQLVNPLTRESQLPGDGDI